MSKLKPATAVALALTMVFASAPLPTLAESGTPSATAAQTNSADLLTQKQAIAKAEELIDIPDGFEFSEASYNKDNSPYNPHPNGTWRIFYTKSANQSHQRLYISLDGKDGTLLTFENWSEPRNSDNAGQEITREAAKEIAADLLHRFAPDKQEHVAEIEGAEGTAFRYDPYYTDSTHSFQLVRHVNGLPYTANSVSIILDKSGNLMRYNISWSDDLDFPVAEAQVTAEEASAVYKDSLEMKLQYQRTRDRYSNQDKLQLVYGTTLYGNGPSLPMIDAGTGRSIGHDGQEIRKQPTEVELTPLLDQPAAVRDKELTQEEAIARVEELPLILNGFKINGVSYQQDYSDPSMNVYDFNFTKEDANGITGHYSGIVRMDAATGDVLDFHYPDDRRSGQEPQTALISKAQAQEKAVAFIKDASATKAHKIALIPSPDTNSSSQPDDYTFHFTYLVDGLSVSNLIMQVTVDGQTGLIQEFHNQLRSLKADTYPQQSEAMPAEQAKQHYLDNYPPILQYVPIYETGKPGQTVAKVALVYAPYTNGYYETLNAVSGDWVSPWGDQPTQPADVTDINGHWAEKSLRKLIAKGVFTVKDGKVNPDAEVTRGELFQSFLIAFNMGRSMRNHQSFTDVPKSHPYYVAIEEGVYRGWINPDEEGDTFRPDETVTREQLAEWIVLLLGYEDLAAEPDAFKQRYTDVPESDADFGPISIVGALGIMNGSGTAFHPDQTITRAQTAAVLDRVTEKFQDKMQRRLY